MAHCYGGDSAPSHYLLPLDESKYKLDNEEAAFFKEQTGIQDDAALKTHLVEIQRKAFEACFLIAIEIIPYPHH